MSFFLSIDGLRVWSSPNNTRLVFDISAPVKYQILRLSNPDRIVVDLNNTTLSRALPDRAPGNSVISGIRSSVRNGHDYRVVLDVNSQVKPKGFLLKPTGLYGHRLVLDLENSLVSPSAKRSAIQTATFKKSLSPKHVTPKRSSAKRDIIVAVDAGHGGEDPGALGRKGTREKDVVLAIARKLEKLLKNEYGISDSNYVDFSDAFPDTLPLNSVLRINYTSSS